MLASAFGPNLTKPLHDQQDLMLNCSPNEPLHQALVSFRWKRDVLSVSSSWACSLSSIFCWTYRARREGVSNREQNLGDWILRRNIAHMLNAWELEDGHYWFSWPACGVDQIHKSERMALAEKTINLPSPPIQSMSTKFGANKRSNRLIFLLAVATSKPSSNIRRGITWPSPSGPESSSWKLLHAIIWPEPQDIQKTWQIYGDCMYNGSLLSPWMIISR